jgi:hypothetical protein
MPSGPRGPTPSLPPINGMVAAARSYVHFITAPASGHNNHQVLFWAVGSDNATVVPYIVSVDDHKTIIPATMVSADYTIHNPYSECAICVRPELT